MSKVTTGEEYVYIEKIPARQPVRTTHGIVMGMPPMVIKHKCRVLFKLPNRRVRIAVPYVTWDLDLGKKKDLKLFAEHGPKTPVIREKIKVVSITYIEPMGSKSHVNLD